MHACSSKLLHNPFCPVYSGYEAVPPSLLPQESGCPPPPFDWSRRPLALGTQSGVISSCFHFPHDAGWSNPFYFAHGAGRSYPFFTHSDATEGAHQNFKFPACPEMAPDYASHNTRAVLARSSSLGSRVRTSIEWMHVL